MNSQIHWPITINNFVFWTAVFPLFLLYILYAYLAIPSFVLLSTQLITLRQKELLKKFQQLLLKCSFCGTLFHKERLSMRQKTCYRLVWKRFLVLNFSLAHLANDIR